MAARTCSRRRGFRAGDGGGEGRSDIGAAGEVDEKPEGSAPVSVQAVHPSSPAAGFGSVISDNPRPMRANRVSSGWVPVHANAGRRAGSRKDPSSGVKEPADPDSVSTVGYSVPTTNGSESTLAPAGAIVKQPARRS